MWGRMIILEGTRCRLGCDGGIGYDTGGVKSSTNNKSEYLRIWLILGVNTVWCDCTSIVWVWGLMCCCKCWHNVALGEVHWESCVNG